MSRSPVAASKRLKASFRPSGDQVGSKQACPRGSETVGHVVAADLARIGLRVRVTPYAGDLASTTRRPGADIVLSRIFPAYPDPVVALRPTLGPRFAAQLDRIARLARPRRLAAAERLESTLLRRDPPAAALGTPTIPERFSARVGCRTFRPLFVGVDLAGLCLAGDAGRKAH